MSEAKAKEGEAGKEQRLLKNVLNALLVAVLGFLMLNLTFIVYAGAYNLTSRLIRLTSGEGAGFAEATPPQILRIALALLIILLSWLVLRSKLNVILKAAFLMVPVATALVTIGIYFYETPIIVYSLGGLICAGLLFWLMRKKWHWLHMYSVLLVAGALTLMGILGIDI
jgi:hypothetical protein